MQHRVKATLAYLQSLVGSDEEVLISLKGNKATMTTMVDLTKVDHFDLSSNPIQNMLSGINEYMCTDCIKIDYLYKDDFFVALVKSYIESLVHEFGDKIPIPAELARAILKFGLCSYKVQFESRQILGHWVTILQDHIDELPGYDFRLIV